MTLPTGIETFTRPASARAEHISLLLVRTRQMYPSAMLPSRPLLLTTKRLPDPLWLISKTSSTSLTLFALSIFFILCCFVYIRTHVALLDAAVAVGAKVISGRSRGFGDSLGSVLLAMIWRIPIAFTLSLLTGKSSLPP